MDVHPNDRVSVRWVNEDWPLRCLSCGNLDYGALELQRGATIFLVCLKCVEKVKP
jgi:hypothetical protein